MHEYEHIAQQVRVSSRHVKCIKRHSLWRLEIRFLQNEPHLNQITQRSLSRYVYTFMRNLSGSRMVNRTRVIRLQAIQKESIM